MVQPLVKTVWRFLKNLKIVFPCDSAIPLLGLDPMEMNTGSQRDSCPPMFTEALLTKAKVWKQSKCPSTDEWTKIWTNIYMDIYIFVHI